MKATGYIQIVFWIGNTTAIFLEVAGEVSLQGLSAGDYNNYEIQSGGDTTITFHIENVRSIAKKGVWKQHITFSDMDAEVNRWPALKEAISDIFLPGYTFTWNGAERTIPTSLDWFPEELKEIYLPK